MGAKRVHIRRSTVASGKPLAAGLVFTAVERVEAPDEITTHDAKILVAMQKARWVEESEDTASETQERIRPEENIRTQDAPRSNRRKTKKKK